MCGITGLWTRPPFNAEAMRAQVKAMSDEVAHRGPDDAGAWLDERAGIALGHRRLAIIDLSPAGHQPMFSADGRWAIVFNGEIYNFLDLRAELTNAGYAFCGASDTEVILAAFSVWGVERALARLSGMFAFAVWDRETRRLYLARDRVGKKPLYVFRGDGVLLFGSELKALCAHPVFPRKIESRAIALFLRYSYIPAPLTIYRDTFKLMPGQFAVVAEDAYGGPGALNQQTYWDAFTVAHEGAADLIVEDERAVLARVENWLCRAVRERMISDVPLGALLSGGIDSSLVTALMQAQSARPVKTFTIGFQEAGFNEAEYARAVAKHLGTDHTELYVTPRETLAVIPALPDIYDEPFADSSQVPTWAVSKLARTQVTVALSGDGGDELFGGYHRYSWARQLWRAAGWAPMPVRHRLAQMITRVPQETWDRTLQTLAPVLPPGLRVRLAGDKAHKAARILDSASADALYRRLVSGWEDIDGVLLPEFADVDHADGLVDLQSRMRLSDLSDRMMLADLKTYLPEDILVKVDRASMAVSLEMRAPLLDHRLLELVWRLPLRYKVRGGTTKWLLRQMLDQYVPRALIARPKTGFGLPIGEWMRGSLREWAEDLLSESRLRQVGFLNPPVVRRYWDEHLTGKRNWQYRLWTLLMLQAWQVRWRAS